MSKNICKELPSAEFLNSLLTYCPETGNLYWKEREITGYSLRLTNVFKARFGKIAGTLSRKMDGTPHAIRVRVDGEGIRRSAVAHRVIWKMIGREVPDRMVIDHIDQNPWNNRLDNLRLATHSQNTANSASKGKKGKRDPSLPKGIDWHPKLRKYRVQIMSNGMKKHIGVYKALEEAKAAWKAEAEKEFGEFACS